MRENFGGSVAEDFCGIAAGTCRDGGLGRSGIMVDGTKISGSWCSDHAVTPSLKSRATTTLSQEVNGNGLLQDSTAGSDSHPAVASSTAGSGWHPAVRFSTAGSALLPAA